MHWREAMPHRLRLLSGIVCLALAAGIAHAQVSPVGGHHAGPGLTPGGGGGDLAVAVEMDLPTPRGDLPVPLGIVHTGGTRVGAAGAGWDMPLSFVSVSDSVSRRKPAWETGPTHVRERVVLNLHGASMVMSESERPNVYTPWIADEYVELARVGNEWLARDMRGRQYRFVHLGNLDLPLKPDAPYPIESANRWYLTEISEAFGADRVLLNYSVDGPCGGGAPLLRSIEYTHAVGASMPLYRIELDYVPWSAADVTGRFTASNGNDFDIAIDCGGAERITVLSRVRDGIMYERTHVVARINIQARDNLSPLSLQSIRSYWLDYAPDVDTHMPRLTTVRLGGVGSTGSASDTRVVGQYEYGAATAGNALGYAGGDIVPRDLRGAVGDSALATSISHSTTSRDYIYEFIGGNWGSLTQIFSLDTIETKQVVADFTGDGLPDLAFWEGSTSWLVPNTTDWTATSMTGAVPLNLPVFPSVQTTIAPTAEALEHRLIPRVEEPIIAETWTQLVDWNADGRVDVLSAFGKDADHWKVYVNQQDSTSFGGLGVSWVERDVRIQEVRQALDDRGVDWGRATLPNRNLLPLARSKTWARRTAGHWVEWAKVLDPDNVLYFIWEQTYFSSDFVEGSIDKLLEEHNLAQHETVETLTEWSLGDSNGDGYVDFRFAGLVEALGVSPGYEQCVSYVSPGETQVAECFDLVDPNHPAAPLTWRCRCEEPKGLEYAKDGQGQGYGFVMRNRAGALSHSNGFTFGDPVAAAPFDAWQQGVSELSIGSTGFGPLDVDGDGLDERGTTRTYSDRTAVCNDFSSPTDEYETRVVDAYVDLTGDGLPDKVSRTNIGGWDLWINTGAGLREPIPITGGFELSRSVGTCGGDMRLVEGLVDIDGDGKPEYARIDGDQMRVSRISSGTDSDGLSAGRMIAAGNGRGAWTRVEFVNAKRDERGRHQHPSAEIVVGKMWTSMKHGIGTPIDPTYYAYGFPERRYDPRSARWTFMGYRRQVTLAGESQTGEGGAAMVSGNLILEDRYPAVESSNGQLAFVLAGRPKSIDRLEGYYPPSTVWSALAIELDPLLGAAGWRGHTETAYDLVELAQSGTAEKDCYDADGPSGQALIADYAFCKRTAVLYAKSSSEWTGTEPFDLGRSSPLQSDNVATLREIQLVDDLARPLLVRDFGSRHTSTDDVCIELAYAPAPTGFPGLTALLSERITACDVENTGRALARVQFEYDDAPVRPTRRVVSRYDAQTGELMDGAWQVTEFLYDNPFLRLSDEISIRKQDGVAAVTVQSVEYGYDVFGLSLTRKSLSSNDPDLTLTETYAWSSIPTNGSATTSVNGATWLRSYDAYGRDLGESVTVEGSSYAVRSIQYDDISESRSLTMWQHGAWHPAADAGGGSALEATTYLDELGRVRATRADLGADYVAALVLGAVTRDGLGRVTRSPTPFVQSGASLEPPADQFGARLLFARDGRVTRRIDAHDAGTSTSLSTPGDDVYVQQASFAYRDGTLVVRRFGVNETTPGHAQYLDYEEEVIDARGRTLHRTRHASSGAVLERVSYGYNRLGNIVEVHRFSDPAAGTDPVSWRMAFDSAGNELWLSEPATPVRYRSYDSNGNLMRDEWNTQAGTRAIVNEYDGFDRLVRTHDEDGGSVVAGSIHVYHYDAPSGDPAQRYPEHLLGQLSYAETFSGRDVAEADVVRSIHYGYDQLGRTRAVAHRGGDGVFEEVYERRLDGNLSKLTYRVPETGNQPEEVIYSYDSAHRLRQIEWDDGTTPEPTTLYEVTAIDPFGRVGRVALGNGFEETYAYEPRGYQLLRDKETREIEGINRRHVTYFERDGEQRVLTEHEFVVQGGDMTAEFTENEYDALDRLSRATVTNMITLQYKDEEFEYDALGNVREIIDHTGNGDLVMVPRFDDLDRVCTSDVSGGTSGGTTPTPTPWPGDEGEYDDGYERIWLEAEQAQVVPDLRVVTDPGASGGGAIWVPQGEGNNGPGSATYTFEVDEPGAYRFFGRVHAPSGADNSFYVRVDGGALQTWHISVSGSWQWEPVRVIGVGQLTAYFGAGTHTIEFRSREDGTKLDRLLVTNAWSAPANGELGPDSTVETHVEAEAGAVYPPFTYQPDSTASAGTFIEVANGHNSPIDVPKGHASYHLSAPEDGLYALWARVSSPYGARSIRVRIDDGIDVTWSIPASSAHTWRQPSGEMLVWLEAGSHEVVFTEQQSGVRIDRIALSTSLATAPTVSLPSGDGCKWVYDSAGNVVTMRSNKWGTRNYSFDNRSRVNGMMSGGSGARYRYDAAGGVAELDVYGVNSASQRAERRYGPNLRQAFYDVSGMSTQLTERRIPAPIPIAVRGAGADAQSIYEHRDPHRGTRMVTDERGVITQLVGYRPFGGLKSQQGTEGSVDTSREKIGGGDALLPFDAVVMGARVYHPRTGRFLQRDPLMVHLGANKLHPYSYAWNDPMNHSDPSGMSPLTATGVRIDWGEPSWLDSITIVSLVDNLAFTPQGGSPSRANLRDGFAATQGTWASTAQNAAVGGRRRRVRTRGARDMLERTIERARLLREPVTAMESSAEEAQSSYDTGVQASFPTVSTGYETIRVDWLEEDLARWDQRQRRIRDLESEAWGLELEFGPLRAYNELVETEIRLRKSAWLVPKSLLPQPLTKEAREADDDAVHLGDGLIRNVSRLNWLAGYATDVTADAVGGLFNDIGNSPSSFTNQAVRARVRMMRRQADEVRNSDAARRYREIQKELKELRGSHP